MAYTSPITWVNGEVVDSARLNAMVGNNTYLLEENTYIPVINGNEIPLTATVSGVLGPSSATITTQLALSGTLYGAGDVKVLSSPGSGSDEIVIADQDISAAANGIHEVTIEINSTYGSTYEYSNKIMLVKTDETNYLTAYLTRYYNRAGGYTYSYGLQDYITIIAHRASESWT